MEENKIYIDMLIQAIKNFSSNPGAIDNLESYLNHHFTSWCEKYASTPEGFIEELAHFSTIQ